MPILVIVSCVVSACIVFFLSFLFEIEAETKSGACGMVIPAPLFKFVLFIVIGLSFVVMGTLDLQYRALTAENETLKKALIANGAAEMVPVTFEFKLKAEK